MPLEEVKGPRSTIDVWWMIHDGGFLILLSWLLTQHRNWRQSQIRVFTLAEDVSEEKAKAAGEFLSRTLRERRLFDVEVEVILADDAMIQPYTYDWTWRVEGRHQFLSSLRVEPAAAESIPLEIDDLFVVDENSCVSADPRDPPCSSTSSRSVDSRCSDPEDSQPGNVMVSDCRTDRSTKETGHVMRNRCHTRVSQPPLPMCARLPPAPEFTNLESCARLNQVVLSRSSEADLVVLNLPDQWGTEAHKARAFMTYCNTLTAGLRHVMFVHSSGHEADSWFQKTRQGALHPELHGLRPDRASFDVMIQGCAKVDDLTRAERYLIDLLERTSDRPHRTGSQKSQVGTKCVFACPWNHLVDMGRAGLQLK
ncbi:SLC12A4 [Symbiodinium microadriaticum]|nr:SLC12A4 [Symbiodinium microadriaticum]